MKMARATANFFNNNWRRRCWRRRRRRLRRLRLRRLRRWLAAAAAAVVVVGDDWWCVGVLGRNFKIATVVLGDTETLTHRHTHRGIVGYRKWPSLYAHCAYAYPLFEATTPGAAPGPPVKPGPVFVASGGVNQ